MSLRTRFLVLTVLFALLLVGTVSVVTYVVVDGAMTDVAEATLLSIAKSSANVLESEVESALVSAASQGLVGRELEETAYRAVVASLPDILASSAPVAGHLALYDGDLRLIWYSDEAALNDHSDHRLVAVRNERTIDSGRGAHGIVQGLFSPANMGVYAVHVPIELPGHGTGVLDMNYLPEREEATIDGIRPWMLLLSMTSTVIAVALMQASAGWILGLIGDLRQAADAVEDNQLDVRLPDLGQHEIGDLARALNGLIERLRQRAEAQTRFVADASHELATPVAGIRGYVNILRGWGGEDPGLREEAVEAIDRESSRMARLCADLLSLVRRERFTDLQVRRVDVAATAREALATSATRHLSKGLEFIGPEGGPVLLYADQDRVSQLLSILVDNAAKYTVAGFVRVRTWSRADNVFVEVSDTGIGIPQKDMPHIFERFYRGDESRSSETGGTGIGLSIARRIVENMGGKIAVKSVEGEGTTFTIQLPRRQPTEGTTT